MFVSFIIQTWWELSQEQRQHFDYMNHLNRYLTEEYHSVAEIMYKTNEHLSTKMPERSLRPIEPHDACRIHGTLTVNKVSGNFHVTAGKSLHFPQGHLHLNLIFDDVPANFSHRITKLRWIKDKKNQLSSLSNKMFATFLALEIRSQESFSRWSLRRRFSLMVCWKEAVWWSKVSLTKEKEKYWWTGLLKDNLLIKIFKAF